MPSGICDTEYSSSVLYKLRNLSQSVGAILVGLCYFGKGKSLSAGIVRVSVNSTSTAELKRNLVVGTSGATVNTQVVLRTKSLQ